MAIIPELAKRILSWLCASVVGSGILLFLHGRGIYPEIWVAGLLNIAATPEVFYGLMLILAGGFGLLVPWAWRLAARKLKRHKINRQENVTKGEAKAGDKAKPEGPKPLSHWFKADFSNTLKLSHQFLYNQTDGQPIPFDVQICNDFAANTYFLTVLINETTKTFDIAKEIPMNYKTMIEELHNNTTILAQNITQQPKAADSLTFSRQVYVYHESHLADWQKADLRDAFAEQSLEVDFRGPDWRSLQWMRTRGCP